MRELKEWGKKKGYSQQLIADKLGITVQYTGLILTGKKRPSRKLLKKISDLIGADFEELLERYHGEKGECKEAENEMV